MDLTNSSKIPDDKKLEKAIQFKQEGNDAYKTKNYIQAIKKYHRALLYLKGIGQSPGLGKMESLFNGDLGLGTGDANRQCAVDPKMMAQVVDLKTDCYNNLAACLLQQESPNYEKVVLYCDYVLQIVPNNVKAIYRKGLSLFQLRDYDRAIQTLKEAHTESLVQKYIIKCKKELEQQDQNMRKAFSGMFDNKATNSRVEDTEDT